MKKPETKLAELQNKYLDLEGVSPEEMIQFAYDTIECMPEIWNSAMSRFYLQGGKQRIDEETGKPLTNDSRYYIACEHARYGLQMLVALAREKPQVLEWLIKSVQRKQA